MCSKRKKRSSAEFNAKVAIQGNPGRRNRGAIGQRFEIHPTMIHEGKKPLEQSAAVVFGRGDKSLKGKMSFSCHFVLVHGLGFFQSASWWSSMVLIAAPMISIPLSIFCLVVLQ